VAECQPWYEDTDGDGFGEGEPLCRCAPTPGFEAPTDGDCDDTVATTFPGAAEACDGVDNNCDQQIDESLTAIWYLDGDGDGFGDPDAKVAGCVAPAGAVRSPNDCDDTNPTVYPGAVEACDGIDNDCDGLIDIEDDSEANLARWKELADFAHARGIQIGGYSLLSSRKIEPESDNCIHPDTGKPGGQIFGHAPALASAWGQRYFQNLRRFFEVTGFACLEHDGSYPGDPDAAARPPLQKGLADSQWAQHAIIADFYRWCRGRGVYLNVPDWYFLNGSNKTGMGYRETNWSLPRAQQAIHARQNMFDGTLQKTSSMGWMFVPLTEYHGGGAAATIEPLAEHLDHYERMLSSTLGYGAQACWRGPRLYDTEATEQLVRTRMAQFVRDRALLQSDVVHSGSRRADGRWLDWCLHVDPDAREALLVAWNPTSGEIDAEIEVDLRYAGLSGEVLVAMDDRSVAPRSTDPRGAMRVQLKVQAGGEQRVRFASTR
jgi:hypothetical protein